MRNLIRLGFLPNFTFLVGWALTAAIVVTVATVTTTSTGRPLRGDPSHNKASFDVPQSREQSDVDVSAWQVIISFENQDLVKLDRNSAVKLQHAIDAVTGKPKPDGFPFMPRLISKFSNANGQYDYVLVEESPLLVIPGESRLRVNVFDLQGKPLSSSDFPSGWRISLTGLKRARVPEIDREILEVGSQPVINGRDIAKQYYALVGDTIMVICLEDNGGKPVKNIFGAPNHTIGPNLAGRSAEEWERALGSADSAEVLSALVWLGGIHWDPHEPLPEYEHEELSEAQLVDAVRSRQGVQNILQGLIKSKNQWVRRAAELAMSVDVYR